MANPDFSVSFDDGGLKARVTAAKARAESIKGVADDIALVIQADADERFNTAPGTETGGAVYGGKSWDKLTDAYLSANPRRRGGQLLRDTGELAQSFQVGGGGNVYQTDTNSIVFGSALPKAVGLNKDRPLLFAHPDLVETVARVWSDYVIGDLAD